MQTQFFYGQYQNVFYDPRSPASSTATWPSATQTSRGGTAFGIWPFNRYRRLELSGGIVNFEEAFEDPGLEEYSQEYQEQQFGRQLLNNGTMAPIGVAFVQETTLFREFGPLAGNTVRLAYEVAPRDRRLLSRQTRRRSTRASTSASADRACSRCGPAASRAGATTPATTTSAATREMRGYEYLEFVGQNAAHLNAELRIPLIHAMATPIGILGGIRGTLFANVGGAYFDGRRLQRCTERHRRSSGRSSTT